MATSTAAKKTTAPRRSPRKTAAVKPIEDIPVPEFDVLDLRSEDADTEPDPVEVFRLNGKPYYVDRTRGAGVAMRFLKEIKTKGENVAVATMLVEMLGDEAYDALANFPGVTNKHLAQVVMTINKILLGDEESGPKA